MAICIGVFSSSPARDRTLGAGCELSRQDSSPVCARRLSQAGEPLGQKRTSISSNKLELRRGSAESAANHNWVGLVKAVRISKPIRSQLPLPVGRSVSNPPCRVEMPARRCWSAEFCKGQPPEASDGYSRLPLRPSEASSEI